MAEKKVLRVGIYARVSSQEQATEGVSIDAQVALLRSYAQTQGWQIAGEYVDAGHSGNTDERPELRHLLMDASQHRFDIIAVSKLDRFFRNLRLMLNYLHRLEGLGIKFVATQEMLDTSTPYGHFALQIMGVIAEFERGRIGERVRDSRRYLTSQGYWAGGRTLYGYRWLAKEHKWAIIEEEAKVVRLVYELYLGRKMGMIAIAIYLNKEGFHTRDGAFWRFGSVHMVLTHPAYKGKHFNGIPVPPLIDEAAWEKAQSKRENARSVPAKVRGWLLQGMVTCGKCGHGLKCIQKRPHEARYYVCRGRLGSHVDGTKRCTTAWVKAEELEWAVWHKVEEALNNPEMLHGYMRAALESLKEQREQYGSDTLSLEQELEAIKSKLERLGIAYADGTVGEQAYHARLRRLRKQEAELLRCRKNIAPSTLAEISLLEERIKVVQDVLKQGKVLVSEFGIFARLGDKYVPVGYNAFRETDGEYAMGDAADDDTFKVEGTDKVLQGIAAPVGFYECADDTERVERIKHNMRAILELFSIRVYIYPERIEIKGTIPEQVLEWPSKAQEPTASIIGSASLAKGRGNIFGMGLRPLPFISLPPVWQTQKDLTII